MNDTAIKNYCMWARRELIAGVQAKAHYYGIREDGYEPAAAEVLHGEVVLTPEEHKQRKGLIQLYEAKDKNYGAFIEQAAYTWFNRIMAIRFMELNDRLPSHTRMFSLNDGSFGSQAVTKALDIQIEGVDQARVVEYKQASDDESLFRYLFLAQCNELSSCMPQVFDPVGSALELLLPDGLLRKGNVIERMVAEIPEEDWREGVEIVGWMYQYYNAERKDEVFASFKKGKKADKESIAPATQLFTPHWIVQYLTENSLGRLWMLNHPNSKLIDQMKYYLVPDEESYEVPQKVVSPEEITVCDPACGSGHILVYAFDLLAAMYEESGYSHRDIPRLVLENNLTGFEIDPRAAEMASFALTMKGCEWDRRFLRRNVQPEIVVLQSVAFEPEELDLIPELAGEKKLLDALAHLSECGSLFLPTDENVAVLRQSLERLQAGASLFSDKAEEKLSQAICLCEQLQRKFSVVVANPPYMGNKNMNKWLSGWVSKDYKEVKSDLFSCFIARNIKFGIQNAQLGFMTPYVWMFIGSYEKLRNHLIEENTITSLVQLEYSGFAGATVPICSFTIQTGADLSYRGGYIRLSDFAGADNQAPKTLEAIENPDCGWFYRGHAKNFKAIPGSPIAYWASDASLSAFGLGESIASRVAMPYGFKTGDNDRFLRLWWEVGNDKEFFTSRSNDDATRSCKKWFSYNKGGQYRRWYGNNEYVLNYENSGREIIVEASADKRSAAGYSNDLYFKPTLTWSRISSGKLAMRYSPCGAINDMTGPGLYAPNQTLAILQGFLNSSVAAYFAEMISPTLDFQPGQIGSYPVIDIDTDTRKRVETLVKQCRSLSLRDWDTQETSWDFKRFNLLPANELSSSIEIETVGWSKPHINFESKDSLHWLCEIKFRVPRCLFDGRDYISIGVEEAVLMADLDGEKVVIQGKTPTPPILIFPSQSQDHEDYALSTLSVSFSYVGAATGITNGVLYLSLRPHVVGVRSLIKQYSVDFVSGVCTLK